MGEFRLTTVEEFEAATEPHLFHGTMPDHTEGSQRNLRL